MLNNENLYPYFWTDFQQAQERLEGSVVLCGENPAYIRGLEEGHDGIPVANLSICNDSKKIIQKKLDDPAFGRFRNLPVLGWVNTTKYSAVFLERRLLRARTHGLCDNSVTVFDATRTADGLAPSREVSFRNIWPDAGFTDSVKNSFPSLEEILMHIREESIIAYSHTFAVLRDGLGLRWLYRNIERVGLFTGTDTLLLFPKTGFYREEIMDDPMFTLNHIKEF